VSIANLFFAIPSNLGRVGDKPGLRVTPNGAGNQSGEDWNNAAPIKLLNSLISRARSRGYDIWLHADMGNYPDTTISITEGGGSDVDHVRIVGKAADGTNKAPLFVGTRANPWTAGAASGNSTGTFLLLNGANHLTFSWINFKNCGLGCFRFGANIDDVIIEDCYAENVRGFQQNSKSGSNVSASCTKIRIRRCKAVGYSKFFGGFRYDSNDIIYEDCWGDSQFQDGDPFCFGIVLNDTAHNIKHYRCTMICHRDSTHGTGYWNSDGYASERKNEDVYYEDCYAGSNTDGGWDCKGTNHVLVRCTSEDNKRNYRIWGSTTMIDCVGINPAGPPVLRGSPGGGGGSGFRSQIGAFYQSFLRLQNCTFRQITGNVAIQCDENSFVAADQATLNKMTSTVAFTKYSPYDPAKDNIFAVWDHNDVTPPTITSPGTYSVPENTTNDFLITSNESGYLEVVGGQNSTAFTKNGRTLRLLSQDFENPIDNPMRVDVRVKDANLNSSSIQSIAIAITDVNDNPIGPDEAFAYGSSFGAWLEVKPSTCFSDINGLIPSEMDGPVAFVQDISGFGNHARQPDLNRQGYLRTDGAGRYWLEMDGFDDYYVIGTRATAWRLAQATIIAGFRRDADATGTDYVFSLGRGATASTASLGLNCQNTQFLQAVINPTNGGADGGAARNVEQLITFKTTTGIVQAARKNSAGGYGMLDQIDLADNNALAYSSGYQPEFKWGASDSNSSSTLGNFFEGRFTGIIILNQPSDDTKRYRLARQLAQLQGINL